MLGIWHGGEWMNRDLTQPFYSLVEHGSPISGWFIAFINEKSIPLIFMCKGTDVFMDLTANMFILFLFLLCWLYVHFMTKAMFVSQHVFNCKWMDIVSMA